MGIYTFKMLIGRCDQEITLPLRFNVHSIIPDINQFRCKIGNGELVWDEEGLIYKGQRLQLTQKPVRRVEQGEWLFVVDMSNLCIAESNLLRICSQGVPSVERAHS